MGRRLLATGLATALAAALSASTALARPGDLYLAGNEAPNDTDIVRMKPATGAVTPVATLPDGLPGDGEGDNAVFGKDGRLYVSDESNNVVFRVNVATGFVETITFASFQDPWGIDIAPNGRILIADYSAESVFTFTPPDSSVTPLSDGGELSRLNAITATPGGRILLALGPDDPPSTTAQILSVNPRAGTQRVVANLPGNGDTDFPQGMTVSPNGRSVFVGRESSIDRWVPGSPSARKLSSSPRFDDLFDIDLGFDGRLYAVDSDDGDIYRVSPRNGSAVTVGDSGLQNAIGIAVQPPRCAGQTATILGTRKADRIKGSPGPDVIAGLAGRDRIQGLRGNDRLCGGRGRDRLLGGRGRDRLIGGPGLDVPRQ
jgi:Ca2+-binding RTX toxin-like protein